MKILLIEDSPEIVKGVTLTFKLRWPDAAVLAAYEGREGVRLAADEAPDIIILDINLPDMTGFEVLESVRQFSDVPVIILTVRDDEVDELRGLEMGADDYIIKPFSPANLLTRVKAVLRRTGTRHPDSAEPATLTLGDVTINFDTGEVFKNGSRTHLTPNESRIFLTMARNEGRLTALDTIKQQVWGNESKYVDNSSLKRYIYQLRLKLENDASQPSLIINERGTGYRLVKP